MFGIPDLPISHGLFPYKEHIKQPPLRRHGAKTRALRFLTSLQKIRAYLTQIKGLTKPLICNRFKKMVDAHSLVISETETS